MAGDPEQLLKPTQAQPVNWKQVPATSGKSTAHGVKLTAHEIRLIVEIWALPPFLNLDQAAAVSGLAPGTLQNQVSQSRFAKSAIKGKPLRFVTIRFLAEVAAR